MKLILAILLAISAVSRAAVLCPPAGCSLACPGVLDDELCYQTPHHNTFRPPIAVTVEDQFGTITANATVFHRLCTPADKNGDCPTCPTKQDHYLGLELHQIVGTPAQPHVTVAYQFGTMQGDIGRPGFLEVPAGKSLTPPAPPPLAGLHSYNCYTLENISGDLSANVHTVDQFATLDFLLDPVRGWTLCVGANVDGTDPGAVGIAPVFLCNLVNDADAKLPFNQKTVFANSGLTGPVVATITRLDNLCLPATILP